MADDNPDQHPGRTAPDHPIRRPHMAHRRRHHHETPSPPLTARCLRCSPFRTPAAMRPVDAPAGGASVENQRMAQTEPNPSCSVCKSSRSSTGSKAVPSAERKATNTQMGGPSSLGTPPSQHLWGSGPGSHSWTSVPAGRLCAPAGLPRRLRAPQTNTEGPPPWKKRSTADRCPHPTHGPECGSDTSP